jgi:hypothetical protein
VGWVQGCVHGSGDSLVQSSDTMPSFLPEGRPAGNRRALAQKAKNPLDFFRG